MKKHLLIAVAAASIAACGQQEPEVVGGPVDPDAEALRNAEPVGDVPQMLASHTYRCSGSNAVLDIDWIKTGDVMTANVRPEGGSITTVQQGEDGGYTADGATLTGSADASSVTYNGTTCRRG